MRARLPRLADEAFVAEKVHLIAVAVEAGRITVVAEGEAGPGKPMRQLFNPNAKPFLPAFVYRLPGHLNPTKLTISAMFMDAVPTNVWAEASADLLAFICGEGRQQLEVTLGGIPGLDAAAHAAIHWNQPLDWIYYGLSWDYPK